MKLTDFARHLPEEVWELFEPLLPPVVWCGNGRPPARNYDCLHAVFYVLVSGIAWRMLPKGFPSYKTVQRRLKVWLQREAFRTAWQQLAHAADEPALRVEREAYGATTLLPPRTAQR